MVISNQEQIRFLLNLLIKQSEQKPITEASGESFTDSLFKTFLGSIMYLRVFAFTEPEGQAIFLCLYFFLVPDFFSVHLETDLSCVSSFFRYFIVFLNYCYYQINRLLF